MFLQIILSIALVSIVIFLVKYKQGRNSSADSAASTLGQVGEDIVASALGADVINERYIINNLTIVNDGKSSQIDHLMITRFGIFVIETKNYAGRIYGNPEQKQWTQVLAYGKSKNRFYNPVLQNRTHIYHLNKVLKEMTKSDCFISFVVFPRANLMTKSIPNVGNISDMYRVLSAQRQQLFSVDELNATYSKLLAIKNNPQISDTEHIENIQQMQQNIRQNICPRCGKELVLRNGKYGSFYGCSGYPNCDFKKYK